MFINVNPIFAANVVSEIATISGISSPGGTNYVVGTVYYATDRKEYNASNESERFGSERSKPARVTYGTCKVSIPKDHRMGELEGPDWYELENPGKHISLLTVNTKQKKIYFSELAARVKKSADKNLFVFIHGFNVSFENAARRTAQLSYDLQFKGAPVFFSWPSQGSSSKYPIDEQNIEWSKNHLKDFLSDVVDKSKAKNIYLIAHSMGNRALITAYNELISERPRLRKRFREIILAAPDIDAELFKNEIAPKIVNSSSKITLYVSSKDNALKLSKKWHGYPRLGENIDREILNIRGIETIDVTNVDTSYWGHSYYGENRSLLSDLYYLITKGLRPPQRFDLEEVNSEVGRYWKFKK